MKKPPAIDVQRLRTDVEWALSRDVPRRDVVRMLEQLLAHAPRGSEAGTFARGELAGLVLTESPWRAARLAHEILAGDSLCHRSWAILGLALVLLRHHESARRAFSRALALDPRCPSYAHNLGHLLDVALDRPRDALPFLERAHRGSPGDEAIAASYAHALTRTGSLHRARTILLGVAAASEEEVGSLLARWAGPGPFPAEASATI